ncbi:MAG TPA: hypothetical protein VKZ84_08280 [Bacteriovoracaceae bacterium]|nr:hypothetical protein [Bacteriovoracaceae bacterium]
MIKVVVFLLFIFSISFVQEDERHWVIRKDYECEIFEKDFFIKDCYRNADLNFDDKKMIADIH